MTPEWFVFAFSYIAAVGALCAPTNRTALRSSSFFVAPVKPLTPRPPFSNQRSVLARSLDGGDRQILRRPLRRSEAEPELFLDRDRQRRCRRIDRRCIGGPGAGFRGD